MSGRTLMIVFLGFVAVFAAGLWYAQFHAFYEETEADTVEIAGRDHPVTDWQGIDAATSPLKLRACFRIADPEAVEGPPAPDPTPLVPPGWFECFDAGRLTADIEQGRATAYLAAREEADGVNRIVAVYPDGRAYMWRQLNEKYADQ